MGAAIRVEQNVVVVQLRGELDHHTVEQIRGDVEGELTRSRFAGLVLSFEGIDFVDSSALGLILGRYRTISQKGMTMALSGVGSSLRRLFEMSGILKILTIYETEAEAIRAVKEA